MPDCGGGGGGGEPSWQSRTDEATRRRVLDNIISKLAEVSAGQVSRSDQLYNLAVSFENKLFHEASSKEDYLRRISAKLVSMERRRPPPPPQAPSGLQQQMHMGHQMRPVNTAQAIHEGHSPVMARPQVAGTMSNQGNQSSQLQRLPMNTPPAGSRLVANQHMAPYHGTAPNMHIQVKQEQLDVLTKPDQIRNSLPAMATPLASAVAQHGQRMIQPGATQNQNQFPAMQRQPTNFSGCNPARVAQPQGQSVVRPNGQQSVLMQNPRGTGMMMQPQRQQMMNQQVVGANQQEVDRKRYQMLVAQQANAARMQTGHPGGRSNQQNAGMSAGSPSNMYIKMEPQPVAVPQQMITVSQQSSLLRQAPQNSVMGNSGEVDWREEVFQRIKPLKDAYLSDLMDLYRLVSFPTITEVEALLPKNKASDMYKHFSSVKVKTKFLLDVFQLDQRNIPDKLRGKVPSVIKLIKDLLVSYRRIKDWKAEMASRRQSHISRKPPEVINLTDDPAPSSGATSQQIKQEQLVDIQSKQNVATRVPAPPQQNHSSILLGVAHPFVPVNSAGSLQPFPTNNVQEFCTPSPVIRPGPMQVSSSSAPAMSTLPSPIARPGAVKSPSPSASAKSASSPLPSPKPRTQVSSSSALVNPAVSAAIASPPAPAKPAFPSPISKPSVAKAPSPSLPVLKPTTPSPVAMPGIAAQAASPLTPLNPACPSPAVSSGAVPVASPCTSAKPTLSSEKVESVSASMPQENAAAAAEEEEVDDSKQVVAPSKPVMPASPIQREIVADDLGAQDQQRGEPETPVTKTPISRLLDAVRSSSMAALQSSANSIFSVVRMNDTVPRMRPMSRQGRSGSSNKMKRMFETTASPPLSSADGSCVTVECDAPEVESNAEHSAKRQKAQTATDMLADEIEAANRMLMDTVISIVDGDNRTDGTLIKFSYTAVSLAPDLKPLFAASGTSAIAPVKLLVPAEYPRRSPVLLNDDLQGAGDEQLRKMFVDVSGEAAAAFRCALVGLREPATVGEVATAWDACVRRAVVEFARRHGGGTFSSGPGRWEISSGEYA